MRYLATGAMALVILFGACSKPAQSERERAVRAALNAHLQQKSNLALNNMTVEIQSVKFTNDDTAEAQVRFQSKAKPDLAVLMHYVLRRAGDHWEVESSSPVAGAGADSHQVVEAPAGPGGPAPSGAAGASPAGSPRPEASH
jgi:hypothetical protein